MVWESFRCLLATRGWLSHAVYWGVASVWPLYHTGLIGGVLQRWLSFWKVLLSSRSNAGALSVTIGFLVTSLTKALLYNPVTEVYRQFLGLHGLVCALTCTVSTVGPNIDTCVPLQIMCNKLSLPQVNSYRVVETSQGWSVETGCIRVQILIVVAKAANNYVP